MRYFGDWCALALLCVLGLAMCNSTVQAGETSITIGAGWNGNLSGSSVPWDNADAVGAYFQLAHEWGLGDNASVLAHWTHISQYDAGKPFNDRPESSVDHLGVAIKWTF